MPGYGRLASWQAQQAGRVRVNVDLDLEMPLVSREGWKAQMAQQARGWSPLLLLVCVVRLFLSKESDDAD